MDAPQDFIRSIRDQDKLELIIPCVGFDDLLSVTLALNSPHADSVIVVTSEQDMQTVNVAKRLGATVVQTDLFEYQGKSFAKGAAINAALCRCQFRGWRLVLDADIVLPDNFRRILINHTALDQNCLYGADRCDVVGLDGLDRIKAPQWGARDEVLTDLPIRARVVTKLYGYLPLGYFQLFHASSGKSEYPSSDGGAGLDDVLFSQQWPHAYRRLLPSVIVYHLCTRPPVMGENWDGTRRHPRLEGV